MEQRSEEWFTERLGKVTASRVADVIAKTKSGYSATRANYMAQIICERLTGQKQDSYSNAAMAWGTETEPQALGAYQFLTGFDVESIGFVNHPSIPMAGASPDGLVGDVGLVEIKCPNSATHIDYLLAGKVPEKYKSQMAWQLACTGREWCDFVSFDPRLPVENQLLLVRYIPESGYINELESEIKLFLTEVEEKITKLKGFKNGK